MSCDACCDVVHVADGSAEHRDWATDHGSVHSVHHAVITAHSNAGAALLRQCFLCVWVCVHASDRFKPRVFPDPLHLGLFFISFRTIILCGYQAQGLLRSVRVGHVFVLLRTAVWCCQRSNRTWRECMFMIICSFLPGILNFTLCLTVRVNREWFPLPSPPYPPHPPFSPALISHIVSVDVKHHVYLRMIMCIRCTQGDCGIKHSVEDPAPRKKKKGKSWHLYA